MMRFRASLRGRVLLIVVAAAVLPIAATGLWITAGAERVVEAHVRERLEDAAAHAAQDLGGRWVAYRSQLVTVAGTRAVRAAATGPAPQERTAAATWPLDRPPREGLVHVVVHEPPARWEWRSPVAPVGPTLDLAIPLFEPGARSADRRLEAALDVRQLFAARPSQMGGAELVLIDRRTEAILTSAPFERWLLEQPRFVWAGEEWISVRRDMHEPPVRIIAFAPLTPSLVPFAEARARGWVLLLAVGVFAVVLALMLTHRTTRSLRELALAAEHVARGGFERTVAVQGADEVAQVSVAFNAMTETLRRTLAQMSTRESLAALGEFTSSLAHEVRNPLTALKIDLQRLQERLSGDARTRETLDRALRSVTRLSATVTGALRIARSGPLRQEDIAIEDILRQATADAEPELRARGATLVWNMADVLPPVTGDPVALHQMFLNVLLNAAQAVTAGGTVFVEVTQQGDVVAVRISDTGSGIPEEARARMFEPFYSTKPEGTGLGLAIARRIALAHGGDITVAGRDGGGTAVTIEVYIGSPVAGSASRIVP